MPNITIDGPRIEDIDKKRELVKAVTDAAVQAYKMPAEHIVVVLKYNEPEDVAVGGKLVIDRKKGPAT